MVRDELIVNPEGHTACERTRLTEREMIYWECGVESGKAEEYFRVKPHLTRAKRLIRLGLKKWAIAEINKALNMKGADDAGER